MSEKLNIGQRINAVRKTCPYIQKAKAVENYKAVTHDQVTAELRASLIEYGVLIVPQLVEGKTVDTTRRTKAGNPIFRFEGTFNVGFVNCDDIQDAISVVVPAHADDQGDKAPGKAISYAVKAAMLKLFSIETGEDEESRIQDASSPFDAEELAAILLKVKTHTSVDDLRAFTKEWATQAAERGDGSARDKIVEAAKKRAAELNAPKASAPVEAPAQNPDAEGPDTDAAVKRGPPASAAMVKMARKAIDKAGKNEADLVKPYHVDSIEKLDKVEVAALMKSLA